MHCSMGFLRVSSTKCWVSQGFPRGFPGVSVVSSTVASVFEAQSKERAKFLRGGECALFQRVSEGFLYKVLGFPGVLWVSCTVASVFEPESKERVVFLRGFHGFPKGFPGFLRFPPRFEKWLIKKASLLNVTFLKSIAAGRPCS